MGQQVANNTEVQTVLILTETNTGFDIKHKTNYKGLIKKEYYPSTPNTLMFPRKWGLKAGVLHFVKHLISNQKNTILKAQERLKKLEQFQTEISEWENDNMND